MPPTNQLATLYCTEADVQAILSTDGEYLSLNDLGETTPDATELAYLTVNGINYATSRVNWFCQGLYDPSQLVQSWMVNEWCSVLAAYWVRCRRGNPAPGSLKEMRDEVLKDMGLVKAGSMQIPDIGLRDAYQVTYSNIIVRPEYIYKKARVETQISDQQSPPKGYTQNVDWSSAFVYEI